MSCRVPCIILVLAPYHDLLLCLVPGVRQQQYSNPTSNPYSARLNPDGRWVAAEREATSAAERASTVEVAVAAASVVEPRNGEA